MGGISVPMDTAYAGTQHRRGHSVLLVSYNLCFIVEILLFSRSRGKKQTHTEVRTNQVISITDKEQAQNLFSLVVLYVVSKLLWILQKSLIVLCFFHFCNEQSRLNIFKSLIVTHKASVKGPGRKSKLWAQEMEITK